MEARRGALRRGSRWIARPLISGKGRAASFGNKENNGCENHEPLQRKGGGQGSKEARDFENNGSFGSTFYPFEQPRYRLCASERGFNEKIFGYQLTRRNPHILGIIRLDKESERG